VRELKAPKKYIRTWTISESLGPSNRLGSWHLKPDTAQDSALNHYLPELSETLTSSSLNMPYGLIFGSEEGFCNLCLFAGKFQDSALNWTTTVSTSIELATVKAHVSQTHCREKKTFW